MNIFKMIFPGSYKCILCNLETDRMGICSKCMSELPFIEGKTCNKCGGHIVGDGDVCIDCKTYAGKFDKCYCVLDYIDSVQMNIIRFKQMGNKYIGEVFAELMLDKFLDLSLDVDLIIPVPIHSNRYKKRGFNQSEILASRIGDETGLVDSGLMIRVKDTPHQTGLSRNNRENNLSRAFKILDRSVVKGKVIMLIDDIYTTGSTLSECADVLKRAGAKKVYALCLARGDTRADVFENDE